MAEKSASILLVCKRFFLTKMRPYLAANAISIANSGIISIQPVKEEYAVKLILNMTAHRAIEQ